MSSCMDVCVFVARRINVRSDVRYSPIIRRRCQPPWYGTARMGLATTGHVSLGSYLSSSNLLAGQQIKWICTNTNSYGMDLLFNN